MKIWILFVLGVSAATASNAQTLRIFHIDVDQGDSTLFVSPSGRSLLVDTGNTGQGPRIRAAMARAGVTQIDHLVTTHYHSDHYGAADELITDSPATTVVNVHDRGDKAFLPASKTSGDRYTEYDNALGHRAHHLMRGETIALDSSMVVTCISSGSVVLGEAPIQHGPDENDMSISLLIQFGDFRYFVGGDIHEHTEQKIANLDLVTEVDVYQANHHGSHTSSSLDFMTDLTPTLIVISNGNHGGHEHPRQVTLNTYAGLTPAPTVLQTNKYTKGGDGGTVADEFIADLDTTGDDGEIVLTVQPDGAYTAAYRGMTRTFQSKPRVATGAPTISIISLLADPIGSDRDLEQVELRNNHTASVDLTGWLLRDESGRVWSLTSLGTVDSGDTATIIRGAMAMTLNNGGDTIQVVDAAGAVVNEVTYGAASTGSVVTF